MNIYFIGGGNMAAAFFPRLHEKVFVVEISPERRAFLQEKFPKLTVLDSLNTNLSADDVLILAAKPQQLGAICRDLAAKTQHALIISIAAGLSVETLSRWLQNPRIVRVMPNIPATVGAAMSGVFAPSSLTPADKNRASQIIEAIGSVLWLEQEADIDNITAISGSGPAYFFYMMEQMQQVAENFGFSPENARQLVLQTASGAVKLAEQSGENFATLRENVTSKGGTTAEALRCFNEGNMDQILSAGMQACRARAKTLGEQLAKEA